MDLERATLRTLFYDYPIEVAMKHIANLSCANQEENFLTDFPQVIRWSEQQYSISELRLVGKLLEYETKMTREAIMPISGEKPLNNVFVNAICMVPQLAKRWLVFNEKRELVVHYSELFRWRDMTLLFGEDFFTTAYLAWVDLKNLNESEKSFVWLDVLEHDNKVLNQLLKQGLTDVHSHYNASVDVFHLNWLSLMNHTENRERYEFKKGDFQEAKISLHAEEPIYKLKNICVAAAYLRCQLFRYIQGYEELQRLQLSKVQDILRDDVCCTSVMTEMQNTISALWDWALQDNKGNALDYAIVSDSSKKEYTPYIIYQGERQLLYNLYRRIFEEGENADELAPYMYLYLLMKNFVRREMVETNQLLGFENFEIYQSRKETFIDKKDELFAHLPQFIFQMNTQGENKVEQRVAPGKLSDLIKSPYGKSIFTYDEIVENVEEQMTFVSHILKDQRLVHKARKYQNRSAFREWYKNQLKGQIQSLVKQFIDQHESIVNGGPKYPLFVGIDAASSELYCRPEVFGQVYRYAALEGLCNRTYHVGEDFFDLVDGLRAIEEAIEFLQLDNNSRLGHVLALGTNAAAYYEKRHYTTITYKQYLLDNLVWLYQKAHYYSVNLAGVMEDCIKRNASRLYNEIGYATEKELKVFDIDTYWDSMWLRSDENSAVKPIEVVLQDKWQQASKYVGHYEKYTRSHEAAKQLNRKYWNDSDVYKKGIEVEIFKWPKEIVWVVTAIQDKMIAEIAEKQIAIECNPSSNVKIGHFDRYDEHPIFRFRPIDKNIHTPILNVSINTDDRGVFATSIYNEFSLIALALTKQRDKDGNRLYNDEAICEYIEHIKKNNELQRFKV